MPSRHSKLLVPSLSLRFVFAKFAYAFGVFLFSFFSPLQGKFEKESYHWKRECILGVCDSAVAEGRPGRVRQDKGRVCQSVCLSVEVDWLSERWLMENATGV